METTSDRIIREIVLRQFDWYPELDIKVSVNEGVVTLAGFVQSFAMKVVAEEAANSVAGVRSVTNEIHVEHLVRREHYSPMADELREHIKTRILRGSAKGA